VFEQFEETRAPGEVRRWAISTGTTVAMYAAAAAAVFTLVGTGAAAPVVKKVQVVFRPPPPAEEAARPPPRRAPPPPVTKKVKVVEVEGLPPPAPLLAPAETPLEKPAEAEPTGEPVVVAVASGSGGGDYGGASISSAPPSSHPIHLPEAATPPQRIGGSEPEYPEEARRAGREGLVVLKVVIDDEGRVTVAEVLRGEEPFVASAVRSVRTWRYRPATLDRNPISIYRVLKLPFRLRS
jgi:protein TonB